MKGTVILFILIIGGFQVLSAQETQRPNIILVMSDDQGWGQTGYNNHPILKTPNLDEMAENGIRFNRFYAGAPVCSPTRASVLTGRSNDRTAVYAHGYAMCKQEKTLAQALKEAGYKTAHFGKWHLNGLRGPGVPILASDERNPGKFGFDEWLSVTNFFDIDPIMSRNGEFVEMKGESSHIIVDEALRFIEKEKGNGQPLLVVIWYGSPHAPWSAEERDKEIFGTLDEKAQNHYGELVSMDQSIGNLRMGLRSMKLEENTLVWFNSDNGGLPNFGPETVGGLRGYKGKIYEGGLRVPCIIEWPAGISRKQVTDYPASTMDIFPTLADIVDLPTSSMGFPIDGSSIKKLFSTGLKIREKPIPFRYRGKAAIVDNNYKLISQDISKKEFELYDVVKDPNETRNIISKKKKTADRMIKEFTKWNQSVEASIEGKDYPKGLLEPNGYNEHWNTLQEYRPYFKQWKNRPEYKAVLKNEN
ncbi:sulfatase-like hydrolase/transferase [Arenibacter sp. S6351L]|uniref:sulfatase-like hydrolase/transferase n=1 Tax=Arenibacter sp. S6351L TaxID=2926407 RepID=UPI001FF45CDB|nr:sulfatase-like hydrolase/transferase [Arenibacter sp. S6351L]MCK0134939.1 sulfatase-like hydrolase/transferase [Arenibacter sp. S6351L]